MSLTRIAILMASTAVAALVPVPVAAAPMALPPRCSGTAPIRCHFDVSPGNYDVTARSRAVVESLGPSASQRLYRTAATDGVTDNPRFSSYGAARMADLVVQGVREQNLSLVGHLR